MSYIELKDIRKSFGDKEILHGINMNIEKGEFVTFLGSSGCGKTTLLRSIIGLETIDSGTIMLDGKDITDTPPQQRGISMIFQQYCLFPTMDLYDNVSFGLRMRKTSKKEIDERVDEILSMVNMKEHIHKYPYQMSGGEQQRAALARGLIMKPKVLLLDEPFSAVDAKLRKELQLYLKNIHKTLDMTTVFVTHDQEEAMRMSDTIHIFNSGVIEQHGSPCDIYANPNSNFVAGFIGSYNLFDRETSNRLFSIDSDIAIRPELISISHEPFAEQDNCIYLEGTITGQIPQGSIIREIVQLTGGAEINVDTVFHNEMNYGDGDHVYIEIDRDDLVELSR